MKPLLNFRPILFAAISLIFGVCIAFSFLMERVVVACVLIVMFSLCIFVWLFITFRKKEKVKAPLIFACVFIFLTLLGAVLGVINFTKFNNAKIGSESVIVQGRVREVKPISGGYYLLLDDVVIDADEDINVKFYVSAYYYGNKNFRLGNTVKFKSIMSDVNDYFDGEYQKYNLIEGIRYRTSLTDDDIIFVGNKPTVFQKINLFIRDTLEGGLDESEVTIAYALICGNSELMDAEILSSYRSAGVAHIFAVSGLHIGFLAGVFNFICKKLKVKPYIKAPLITIVLILYSGICGFSASSIRATIMCATMLFASAFGKKYDPLSAISLSAIGILLCSPFQILSAGFQLSFGVSAGLIILVPPTTNLLRRLPKKIRDSLSVAVVAQVVGIPIMLAHFGEFSLISIFANVILIPIVSILYVFIIIGILLSAITTHPAVCLFLQNYALKGVNFAITGIDYKIFIVGGLALGFTVVFYNVALAVISGVINLKKMAKLILSALFATIFVLSAVCYNVAYHKSFKAYLIGEEYFNGAVISCGKTDVLVVNYAKFDYETKRVVRALNKLNVDKLDALILLKNGDNLNAIDETTSTLSFVKADKLIYCDDYDSLEYGTLNQILHETEVEIIERDKTFNIDNLKFTLFANGYCLEISNGKKSILFVSPTNYPLLNYEIKSKNYDCVVTANGGDEIKNLGVTSDIITYVSENGYKNAQTYGNYLIKFR